MGGQVSDESRPAFAAGDVPMLSIDGDRLLTSLEELGQVGHYRDEASGLTGVNRRPLTDADAAGRLLLMRWMEESGLAVTVDEMGNIFGRREGADPSLPPVMGASHIDSVSTAGIFDGCLGVLGALEVVRSLNDQGIETRRAIVIGAFTEEEGSRFGTSMLGSAVAAGRLTREEAYALTDENGRSVQDELERIGFKGSQPVRLEPPHAYVECHVEQGPTLLQEGVPVGVVLGVQAISWLKVTLQGRAAHAGTTPIDQRIDAGLAAAELVIHLRAMATSDRYGHLRSTVGNLTLAPGLPNVVPGQAEVTVDLRNPDDALMVEAERDFMDFVDHLPTRHPGLHVTIERLARTRQIPFDPRVQDLIASVADDLDIPARRMMSGAGHDAQEIAAIAPTAMIFVRGQYDGISHNPREYSTPEDCVAGVTVLGNVLLRLAMEPAAVDQSGAG
jgi:N-carbamoyl-L-amino-acid hydrolase